MAVKLVEKYLSSFLKPHEVAGLNAQVQLAHQQLHARSGAGSDFLGWLELPKNYDRDEFARIQQAASKIQKSSQVLVVIGIGGSYLGARAAIECLHSPYYNNLKKDTPDIYFAGNNISTAYMQDILSLCEGKDISVNVISKSGTTTEPALAFRIFKELLETRYGKEGARERIFVTTDRVRGALKKLADAEGYETFVVPDDVGGRYSVLTACGLLPIAVSGVDLNAMMKGAYEAMNAFANPDLNHNDCYRYAVIRNCLLRRGKSIELLVSYEPRMAMMAEWYKQLFGESEGKDGKGLFPGSVMFSTDLHSLGQYIQDGMRTMFETVLSIGNTVEPITVKRYEEDFDGLNYLAGKTMADVNHNAFEGTILAHTDGGVPNMVLEIPEMNAYELGYLIYFFEKACAMSGYLLGINPFDQPGVESYKKNMFALLGKPGYEDLGVSLKEKLANL